MMRTLIRDAVRVLAAAGLVLAVLIPLRSFWMPSGTFVTAPWDLDAVATHGNDLFVVATSPIGAEAEAVFFLDGLTGDLHCLVKHRRNARAWAAHYQKNVYEDLQIQAGAKKPKLLMVTGISNFPGTTGNARLATTLVYIVDATTGRFAVYGIPWNHSLYTRGQPQTGPLLPLNAGSIRQPDIIRS